MKMKTTGEVLRHYRKLLGKTQHEFATMAGVELRHYQRVEYDEKSLSLKAVRFLIRGIEKAGNGEISRAFKIDILSVPDLCKLNKHLLDRIIGAYSIIQLTILRRVGGEDYGKEIQ